MIGWAIEMLVATTLLMLLALLLRGPVRRAFGSGMAYALWLLPAARLVLPALPGDRHWSRLFAPLATRAEKGPGFTVGILDPSTLPPEVMHHATVATAAIGRHHAAVALVPPVPVSDGPTPAIVLAVVWIAGAVLFLGYHAIAHVLFCRRLLRHAAGRPVSAAGRVRVIESAAAPTPLAFGIVRRYVAFPPDFTARYDADERELALLHELGHHRRGDLIANWAALAVLAIHWFNPVAWRAFRAFRADQEMANDAQVLAGRSAIDRHAYACAIVKAAHPGFGAAAATCQLNSVGALKGRLKMLTTGRRSRTRLALGAAVIAGLGVAGLGLTASGSVAARVAPVAGHAAAARAAVQTAASEQAPPAPPVSPAEPVAQASAAATPVAPAPAVPPIPATVPVPPVDAAAIQAQVADAMAHMPQVTSATCGAGDPKQMVINDQVGGQNRITICQDRIATAAASGAMTAAQSADIERNAYRAALSGLRAARAQTVADRRITGDARREALASIDESIAELQGDLAKAGKDDD